MKILMPLVVFAICLGACGDPPVDEAASGQGRAHMLDCPHYDGLDTVAALAESHVLIFGEAIHGTNESPEALSAMACGLLAQGEPVRVGLEATYTQTAALNAFLENPENLEALRLGASDMWSTHDGRSSVAILSLLKTLAGWRKGGANISVFAFDANVGEWVASANQSVARDDAMARHVNEALNGFDGAVLLLTGGFHARKEPFSLNDHHFVPMATGITSRPVLSLEMRHAGGSGWMIGEVDGEPFKGAIVLNNLLPEGSPVRAFRLESPSAAYDGIYFTGPITASPPAFP